MPELFRRPPTLRSCVWKCRHGGGNLEVNTVTPSQVPCCCWANSANWVTRGLINSVLLLGFLGWVLGWEAKLAVLLLGFATGVIWHGEIKAAEAGGFDPPGILAFAAGIRGAYGHPTLLQISVLLLGFQGGVQKEG